MWRPSPGPRRAALVTAPTPSVTSSPTPATPTATPLPGPPPARRRRAGVQDLHPSDRGPQGTHRGAIIANGSLTFQAAPGFTPQAAAANTISTNSTNVMACTLVQ